MLRRESYGFTNGKVGAPNAVAEEEIFSDFLRLSV
jgi:hypothetical protein